MWVRLPPRAPLFPAEFEGVHEKSCWAGGNEVESLQPSTVFGDVRKPPADSDEVLATKGLCRRGSGRDGEQNDELGSQPLGEHLVPGSESAVRQ